MHVHCSEKRKILTYIHTRMYKGRHKYIYKCICIYIYMCVCVFIYLYTNKAASMLIKTEKRDKISTCE